MEYRLNKVDMEVRQRIEDTTREGMIHRKKELKIDKDAKDKKEDKDFSDELKKYKGKKKKVILVQAEKIEEIDVEAIKYKGEENNLSRGRFLDTKR
ncbi:hypothetical protein GCM10008905_18060 [Clostridium malenominatum]|uniref:Uncharacterized protein n=1 Tax=Clostridium malenominatum TaxID=1539 RepID=A0ABN1IZ34_9CLOT